MVYDFILFETTYIIRIGFYLNGYQICYKKLAKNKKQIFNRNKHI